MSKKRRNLWLLIALTVVMGGALWLLLRGGGEEGHTHAHDVSDSDESGRQSGILVNEAQEDLQGLVFRNENAEYTAYLNETSGQVAFRELEGYPVNENFMEYVWFSVPQMLYQDIIIRTDDEGYSAKTYGLDKPALTVKATFATGKTYEFYAGSNVPGYDEDVYYVRLKGDKNIYACTLDTPLFMGNSYYLSDDIFYEYDKDIDEKKQITIGKITLSGDNFDGSFVMQPSDITNLSDPFYGYEYLVTSPVYWPVKKSSASMLVYDLTYLMADDVAALNPTQKQLRSYGLRSPALTVSFVRNGRKCVLYGSKPEKGVMYVMVKGQSIVYRLDTESLSLLHNLSPQTLYSVSALSVSLEAISGIQVKSADVSAKVSVTRSKNENAITENDLIYTYTAKANGKEIGYSLYTNFVKQMNDSVILQWNVSRPKGKATVTLTIQYFDNYQRKSDTILFYRVSDREYAVVWGDQPVNTVTATWLNRLLENAKKL